MERFAFAQRDAAGPIIFDVDVHEFPARAPTPRTCTTTSATC